MVTINSLHVLLIGIFFLVTSQIASFQESLLSFMLIVGIILVVVGIIGGIMKIIGKKIKKELGKEGKQKSLISKNNYFTYFLIALAAICILYGYLAIPSTI